MILQNIPNIVFATTIIVVANTISGQDLKPYFFSGNRLCGYGSMVLRFYKIDVWTQSYCTLILLTTYNTLDYQQKQSIVHAI